MTPRALFLALALTSASALTADAPAKGRTARRRALPPGYTSSFAITPRVVGDRDLPPPTSPPVLPTTGALQSGTYRNMFVEYGYEAADVAARVETVFQQLFFGAATDEAIFYDAGNGTAYVCLGASPPCLRRLAS